MDAFKLWISEKPCIALKSSTQDFLIFLSKYEICFYINDRLYVF